MYIAVFAVVFAAIHAVRWFLNRSIAASDVRIKQAQEFQAEIDRILAEAVRLRDLARTEGVGPVWEAEWILMCAAHADWKRRFNEMQASR